MDVELDGSEEGGCYRRQMECDKRKWMLFSVLGGREPLIPASSKPICAGGLFSLLISLHYLYSRNKYLSPQYYSYTLLKYTIGLKFVKATRLRMFLFVERGKWFAID